MEKLENVAATYNSTFVPLCNKFLQTQYPNVATMQKDHTAITDGVLAQIILKLDDVDIQGDEVARIRRKGLIDDVQGTLAKLDNRIRAASELEIQMHTGGAAHVQTQASAPSDAPPQPGISRKYTIPPEFHSTVNPAELSAGLGFVELPGSMPTTANVATLPMRSELPSTTPITAASKPSAVRRKAPPPPRKVLLATALYAFEPEEADGEELAFNEGDIIEIVEKNNELEADGWCRARIKGQRKLGLAPMDYLEEHPGQAPLPAKPPPRPMAAVAEAEGENAPAPGNSVNPLGQTPLFMDHGASVAAGGSGGAQSASPPKQDNSQVGLIQPVSIVPAQPSNVMPPADNQNAPVQPIQPVQLTSAASASPQRPSAGDPSQSQSPPGSFTTPPPPYEAGHDHASTVGNGAAASYYADSHTAHPAAASGAEETTRSGKVLTPLPPGVTNPNHNAGTFIATQIFNRPKPPTKDSTDSQMSPAEGEVTMRGLGTHPAGPAPGSGPASPSTPATAGAAAARPPSMIQRKSSGQSQPTPRPTAYGQQPAARPPGPPGAPSQQSRPNRASPPAQAGGPSVAQNARTFSSILDGVGRIISSNRRNDNNGNSCGGCNGTGCARCGSQSGSNGEPAGTTIDASINISSNTAADPSQEHADLRTNTVSPVDQGYMVPLDAAVSISPPTFVAPSATLAQPTATVQSSDAGVSFVSSSGDAGADSVAFESAPEPSSSTLSVPSDSTVAVSPLAGLTATSNGGSDSSYFAVSSATDGVTSPLAGLAPAASSSDAGLSTQATATDGVSPLAGLAVTEEASTVDLGGGMTSTTTTTTATDADGGVVAAAVETDVSGAPIGGPNVVVAEENTASQSGWGTSVGYDGGDYGDSDEGDW